MKRILLLRLAEEIPAKTGAPGHPLRANALIRLMGHLFGGAAAQAGSF